MVGGQGAGSGWKWEAGRAQVGLPDPLPASLLSVASHLQTSFFRAWGFWVAGGIDTREKQL